MSKKIILLAILLRILIMPFYFHPDIKTYHFQSSFLRQGVFNIYTYLEKNKENLPLKEEFVYFPLTFLFLGGYQILISPLMGANFHNWLADASVNASTYIGVYRYLFILKLPYLILDIAIAILLVQFFTNIEDKKRVLIYYLFNPIWIILIYVYSNVDILAVFVSLISLLLFQKNKLFFSSICLGISAGFKAYPLIFLPFMLLFVKGAKQKMTIALSSLIAFLIIAAPFWSESFKNSALISGLTTRIFLSGLNIGFGESLLLAIIALSTLFFYALLNKQKQQEDFYKVILAQLLLLFSFIHFHIQWLLWVSPLLSLVLIYKKSLQKVLLTILIVAFLIPLFYQDQAMTFGLLKSINPFYNLLPIPFVIVQKFYDPYIVQSILHSILAGGSLILIWNLFKSERA